MRVGTKSVLFGVHCFLIHPWFVALAWWRLYGFPFDPRLWAAFFLHDIGYWGMPNMDGEEGEDHPFLGAIIMNRLAGWEWAKFTLYHSRFIAKRCSTKPSRLCYADKLATCITPRWLYLMLANLSGEIHEYMEHAVAARRNQGKYAGEWNPITKTDLTQKEWHESMTIFMRQWVSDNSQAKGGAA